MKDNIDTTKPDTKPESTIKPKKSHKKKHRHLKRFVIFVSILAAIIITLGFIFQGLLWQKDLGIRYTQADYNSAVKKLGYSMDKAPNGDSADLYNYVFGDLSYMDAKLTSEEITAFINTNRPSYFAIKNVQVRINADGSAEAVGSLNVDYVLKNVLKGEYSRQEIVKNIPPLGLLPSNVNVYLKADGNILNNKSTINLQNATVQGIPIPDKYVSSNDAYTKINEGIENLIGINRNKTGSSFDSIKNDNGSLLIKGNFASSLKRIAK